MQFDGAYALLFYCFLVTVPMITANNIQTMVMTTALSIPNQVMIITEPAKPKNDVNAKAELSASKAEITNKQQNTAHKIIAKIIFFLLEGVKPFVRRPTLKANKQKTHISVGICLHSNRPYSVKMQLTGPYTIKI